MTVPTSEVFAFHIGLVVRDIETTSAVYSELLGVKQWHTWLNDREGLPTNPETAGQRGTVRAAYGRAPGQTIELLQPIDGTTIWSNFLRDHGEGVQHIGFWTRDLPAALEKAIAFGAKIVQGFMREGTASVQLSPSSAPDAILPFLDPEQLAYTQLTSGGVLIEFMGSGGPQRMRERIGDDIANVLSMPPWIEESRS
jgi:catechol 2,3-dioxygenase-like lactoylglutathione lyase family enzyme